VSGPRESFSFTKTIYCSIGGILAHEVVSKSAIGLKQEASRLGGGVAALLYLYTFMYGSTWLMT
jgi:hypothetical protein